MNNIVYASTMGSVMEMNRMKVVSNNLANINTPGFKADNAYFRSNLSYVSRDGGNRSAGSVNSYLDVVTDLSPGPVAATGNPLDVAVKGEGFLVVQAGEDGGEYYTKAGNLRLDPQGVLVTAGGQPVMGQGGRIELPQGEGQVVISPDGTISVGSEEVDRLRIVAFDDPDGLSKAANNNFAATSNSRDVESPEIESGALELSNVNPIRMMTELVDIHRTFDAYQRIISMENENNQRAAQRLAKL